MAKQIDTVTVEVVRNLLMSIAEETYGIIVRSAYSTNMKERRDVCTAVIDPDGNSVAQVESLAALLGSMLSVVPNIYEKFGKGLKKDQNTGIIKTALFYFVRSYENSNIYRKTMII